MFLSLNCSFSFLPVGLFSIYDNLSSHTKISLNFHFSWEIIVYNVFVVIFIFLIDYFYHCQIGALRSGVVKLFDSIEKYGMHSYWSLFTLILCILFYDLFALLLYLGFCIIPFLSLLHNKKTNGPLLLEENCFPFVLSIWWVLDVVIGLFQTWHILGKESMMYL